MGLKENHNVANFPLLIPGPFDHLGSLCPYALNLSEPLYVVFDDLERVLPKLLDDSLGHDRANALDEPRAKVLLDAMHRGWNHRFIMDDPELLAVFSMTGPLPLGLNDLSGHGSEKCPHHRDEVFSPVDFDLGNGEAIVLVGIGDPFNLALKLCEHHFALHSYGFVCVIS